MVLLWSSLATRDARLAVQALRRDARRPAPTTAWVTYVRCHDDIGWAVSDETPAAVGRGRLEHRAFLVRLLQRRFRRRSPAARCSRTTRSTARRRTRGMAASLAGLDAALEQGDAAAIDAGLRRLAAALLRRLLLRRDPAHLHG